jgi:hypothetical protein
MLTLLLSAWLAGWLPSVLGGVYQPPCGAFRARWHGAEDCIRLLHNRSSLDILFPVLEQAVGKQI